MPEGGTWRKTLLGPEATLEDAIRTLNDSGVQIVLVVDQESVLLGTLTDGDVRRRLLEGGGLWEPLEAGLHQDPLVAPPDLGKEAALRLMRANRVRQLPVVDAEGRVVGLHLLDEMSVSPERSKLMVVMAGGEGRRLRPYTEECPKPLLPVGGKPILEHILERARAEGFGRFVFAVHYLGEMIQEHFGDGSKWGVEIDYVWEDRPLGTAGALSLLNPLPDDPFLVTNGDVLTGIRYGELLDFHRRQGAASTMAVREHRWQHPFGVVLIDGVDIVGFDEKPVSRSYINAGVYALEPNVLGLLPDDAKCDMPELFRLARSADLRTVVYPVHEDWVDVGRVEELERTRAEFPPPRG